MSSNEEKLNYLTTSTATDKLTNHQLTWQTCLRTAKGNWRKAHMSVQALSHPGHGSLKSFKRRRLDFKLVRGRPTHAQGDSLAISRNRSLETSYCWWSPNFYSNNIICELLSLLLWSNLLYFGLVICKTETVNKASITCYCEHVSILMLPHGAAVLNWNSLHAWQIYTLLQSKLLKTFTIF